eukprot:11424086-Alexandrium_andersonii.AAC.1
MYPEVRYGAFVLPALRPTWDASECLTAVHPRALPPAPKPVSPKNGQPSPTLTVATANALTLDAQIGIRARARGTVAKQATGGTKVLLDAAAHASLGVLGVQE